MSFSKPCFCVLLLYFLMNDYQCLKIIPERAKIIYYNKLYIEDNPIFNVRRYSRKGDYCINMVFHNKVALNNTITLDAIFYEYLHNEFRRSFPEMHFKLCDLIYNDPYLGQSIRQGGLTRCPIEPGIHEVKNITFNMRIPSVWPFEKGMVQHTVKLPNGVLIAKGEVVLTFKQDLPRHHP